MFKPVDCTHVLGNGKSARTAPLHHCSTCGKPPAILGVLPYTKAEQAFLDKRNEERAAALAATDTTISTKK